MGLIRTRFIRNKGLGLQFRESREEIAAAKPLPPTFCAQAREKMGVLHVVAKFSLLHHGAQKFRQHGQEAL